MTPTVLHVITGLGAGGAERMLTRVAFANCGPDAPRQVVVSLMDEGVHGASLRANGVELHCLGMRRRLSFLALLPRLIAVMRKVQPDVIMTWLYHADLVGILGASLAGLGVRRVVWNLRCSDIDFSHHARSTRWAVSLLAWLSPLPWAVATNSQAGRRAHEALGYRPRRWIYLPNGFDTEEWRPDATDRAMVRNDLDLADSALVVGMVARADPQKDYATFLAAAELVAAQHPQACFVLIGRNTGQLRIPPILLGRLTALGERRDVARLLRGLDIAVLSSAYGEGFPNTLGEAMATELPCVATDVGDVADLIGDAELVVAPRNPMALANAIDVVISESRENRALRGQRGREKIKHQYGIERVARIYRDLWFSVWKNG